MSTLEGQVEQITPSIAEPADGNGIDPGGQQASPGSEEGQQSADQGAGQPPLDRMEPDPTQQNPSLEQPPQDPSILEDVEVPESFDAQGPKSSFDDRDVGRFGAHIEDVKDGVHIYVDGRGSGKETHQPNSADPTDELSQFELEFEPLQKEIDELMPVLLKDRWLILFSRDPEVADSYAHRLAREPEFEKGFARRMLQLNPDAGCKIRHCSQLLSKEIAPDQESRLVVISASSEFGGNPVEFVRSLVAGQKSSQSNLRRKLALRKSYWIVATDIEITDESGRLRRYEEIDFLPLWLRDLYPTEWEDLLRQVAAQRDNDLWPKQADRFFEICRGFLRQQRLEEAIQEKAAKSAEQLQMARREEIGFERLLETEKRIEAVIHFVVTFFPEVEVLDFDRLVGELIKDSKESDRVESAEGMAWREQGKTYPELWRENRARLLNSCGVVTMPPNASKSGARASNRSAPTVDYRDPEARQLLRDFFWAQGHTFFLEQLDKLETGLLFDPSRAVRTGLSKIVAETADAYPEHFGSAWLRRMHNSLAGDERIQGQQDQRLVRALEALVRALLQRKQSSRIVGRFFGDLESQRPALHIKLTRAVRLVENFDPLVGWRKNLSKSPLFPIVPGADFGNGVGGSLKTAEGRAVAVISDLVDYLEEPQIDEHAALARIFDWAAVSGQEGVRLRAFSVLLVLQLGWRMSLVDRVDTRDEAKAGGGPRLPDDERVDRWIRGFLGPGGQKIHQDWIAMLWHSAFSEVITLFIVGERRRILKNVLAKDPMLGGESAPPSRERLEGELRKIHFFLEWQIYRVWIGICVEHWLLGSALIGQLGKRANTLRGELGEDWLQIWRTSTTESYQLFQAVVTADWWIRLDGFATRTEGDDAARAMALLDGLPKAIADSVGSADLRVARQHWLFMAKATRKIRSALKRELRLKRGAERRRIEESLAELSARLGALKQLEKACRGAGRKKIHAR